MKVDYLTSQTKIHVDDYNFNRDEKHRCFTVLMEIIALDGQVNPVTPNFQFGYVDEYGDFLYNNNLRLYNFYFF